MRKHNKERMTIVEQLIVIKEDTCKYACKYREYIMANNNDPVVQQAKLQDYCKACPMNSIHY